MVEIDRNGIKPERDLTGRRYGNLEVIEFVGRDKTGNAMWKCRCDCGREKIIQHFSLINGRSKSCGCRYSKHPRLEGKKIEHLEVLKEVGRRGNKIVYRCRCDCGKEIEVTDSRLRGGLKSCGCLVGRKAKELQTAKLEGRRFNHLTVKEKIYSKNHRQYWKCQCDCGREIEVNTTDLTKGLVKACNNKECKYSRESVSCKGRLPNWYKNCSEDKSIIQSVIE